MSIIILVSSRPDRWREFSDALQADLQTEIVNVRSGTEALKAAQKHNPLAAVIDVEICDHSAVDLVRRLLSVDAMINTALASEKPEEIFHAETEGLGILMKLSTFPTPAEASRFAQCLRQVSGVA